MSEKKRAVVLMSGGIDSTTALAIAQNQSFEVYAITFRYGQRHVCEIQAAAAIAKRMAVAGHVVVDFDLRVFGGSALTADMTVPTDRTLEDMGHGIPVTYVPARNTIFLSFALAYAETLTSQDIFIGVNALDYSGYPDCRPEYIAAYQQMANLATAAGVDGKHNLTIHTPLIHLTKAEIIQQGAALGVDYGQTHNCYNPSSYGAACGRCDSCLLRMKGFVEAGVPDPTRYVVESRT